MSIKHSEASKKRWAKISKIDRSKIMSKRSNSRWNKLDPKARRKIALQLVKARSAK